MHQIFPLVSKGGQVGSHSCLDEEQAETSILKSNMIWCDVVTLAPDMFRFGLRASPVREDSVLLTELLLVHCRGHCGKLSKDQLHCTRPIYRGDF